MVEQNASTTPGTLDLDLVLEKKEKKRKEKKNSRSVADATRPTDDPFEVFCWSIYPKRKGPNPKKPARARFLKHIRDGVEPEQIAAGVRRYAEQMREVDKVGTEFVQRTITWLNQWSPEDDQPAAPAAPQHFVDKHETRDQFDAWYLHYLINNDAAAINGMNIAAQSCRRSHVPSEWPQDYDPAKRFPLRMVRQGTTHRQNAWYAFFGERRATFMQEEFWRREISLPAEWPPGHVEQPQELAA